MDGTLLVLLRIAFRNLFASRLKTAIVGGIIFFGALLVTVGASFLDSVTTGMGRSIIGTLAGNAQVYSAKSKDDLALFGSMGGGESDLEQIEDFAKVKQSLSTIPNVAQVIPMGLSNALVTSGNTIDVVLEKLRAAVRRKLAGDESPAVRDEIQSHRDHVQQIVSVLMGEQKNGLALIDQRKVTQEDRDNEAALARAAGPEFWAGFDRDPLPALEFLENRIAPQSNDADMLYLRYVGTDVAAFQHAFERFHIVEGQTIPEGQRGFLFSKFFYEDRVKLKTARRLDKIRTALTEKGQTLATDPDLQRMVHENTVQTREILLQLDPATTRKARALLQSALGVNDTDVGKLLAAFFQMDDRNFGERYQFFYKSLAPLLELYRIRIGDTLTIKAFTKTGYSRSVNLKVYGTFEFTGLEKSPLAGAVNVMDLVSFRDLYGFLTADSFKEVQKLKAAAGAREIDRDKAEDELFGAASGSEVVAGSATENPPDLLAPSQLHRENIGNKPYDPSELQRGIVLNAAIILKDPRRLKQTLTAIKAVSERDGLDLKVSGWQAAAGIIGNLVMTFRYVLYAAVLVIFLVALVIINNALVMATLERVREIGTLRAVGAQRTFILGMLVVEAATIGLVFGGLGAGVGSLIVFLIGIRGIPASTDVLHFFFSGPRLHPFLDPVNVMAAVLIVLLVATLSSLYPAWLAMRVSPRQAMASED